MKIYYQDPSVVIIHGDSREIVPTLTPRQFWPDSGEKFDLLLTDPQYGIGFKVNAKRSRRTGLDFGKNTKNVDRNPKWVPLQNNDKTPFDPGLFLGFEKIIMWGANCYASRLPDSRGWLVWDKLGDKAPCAFGDCELAWTNMDVSIRIWRQLWRGLVREGEDNAANGPKLHPCQKPAELMRWCIQQAGDCFVILDPYAGSCTTGRAAKDLGIRSVCIEMEEEYCEAGAKRMAQEVLSL